MNSIMLAFARQTCDNSPTLTGLDAATVANPLVPMKHRRRYKWVSRGLVLAVALGLATTLVFGW